MTLTPLPERRTHDVLTVIHNAHTAGAMAIDIGLGRYDNGRLGEVFIDPGTAHAAMMRDVAILISRLLQHGDTISGMQAPLTRDEDGKTPLTLIGFVIDAVANHEKEPL